MLLQAIVEYGVQAGGAGRGSGVQEMKRELAGAVANLPGGSWTIVAVLALLGVWLLAGARGRAGLSASRLVGLVLLAGAAYLTTERLGITHLGEVPW